MPPTTLKAFVTALEELPENLREYYKQQDDGRYKYNADDVEDVTGLKSALGHERDDRKAYNEKYTTLAEKVDGMDLDLAKDLLAQHEKGKRKKMIEEDRVEELIAGELEKRISKMQENHQAEMGTVADERDKLKSRLEVVLIDNSLTTEASKAGVLADALPDVIRRGRERFYLEGDAVVAKDGDGNILYGADGKSSQMPGEFMEELKGGARHLFQPSKGGGAGRQFNSGHSGAVQGNENVRGLERMRLAREH
jgi:bacterioferritin (cytochrome b1)